MRDSVVVVGPTTIRGPGPVDPELATIALDGLDDQLALVGHRPVSVDDLWRDVLASAVAGADAEVVLVHPSWWPASRADRIRAATRGWSRDVVVSTRRDVLALASPTVELARELVVVYVDGQRHVIARGYPTAGVLEAIAARLDGLPEVTIDVPTGIGAFAATLTGTLRDRGLAVTLVDDRALVTSVPRWREATGLDPTAQRRVSPRAAAVLLAMASAGALAAAAVGGDGAAPEPVATTWLVEGRVAVEVPAEWTVERMTSGPGSARVQVTSPDDRSAAIHVTQSRGPDAQSLDAVAESLRAALAVEPEGVFVDFSAPAMRAHRAAVTYRENRPDRHVDWTVLIDDGVRIAIGCQGMEPSLPGRPCDRAVGSAHAVAPK